MPDKKELTLYEKVKVLKEWERKYGKRAFWLCVRGFTGQSYKVIEKILPGDMDYLLQSFTEHSARGKEPK